MMSHSFNLLRPFNRFIVTCLLFVAFMLTEELHSQRIMNLSDSEYIPQLGDRYTFRLSYSFDHSSINPNIDSLLNFLLFNKGVSMEIGVHTNSRGDLEFNDSLSYHTASLIKRFLVTNNIDSNRINISGLGERVPFVIGESGYFSLPKGGTNYYFRKGDTLNDSYINKLSTRERIELIHYLNARIECRITGIQ